MLVCKCQVSRKSVERCNATAPSRGYARSGNCIVYACACAAGRPRADLSRARACCSSMSRCTARKSFGRNSAGYGFRRAASVAS